MQPQNVSNSQCHAPDLSMRNGPWTFFPEVTKKVHEIEAKPAGMTEQISCEEPFKFNCNLLTLLLKCIAASYCQKEHLIYCALVL